MMLNILAFCKEGERDAAMPVLTDDDGKIGSTILLNIVLSVH